MTNKYGKEDWFHVCYETEWEAKEAFENYVDEVHEPYLVFGMEFFASDILKECPTDYYAAFLDWLEVEAQNFYNSQKEAC